MACEYSIKHQEKGGKKRTAFPVTKEILYVVMCGYTKTRREKKTQTVSAEKIDPPTTASDLLFAGGDIKETFFFFLFSLINTMIIIITKRDFVT